MWVTYKSRVIDSSVIVVKVSAWILPQPSDCKWRWAFGQYKLRPLSAASTRSDPSNNNQIKKTAICHVNKISGSIFISFYLCTHMFAVGGDTINIWFKGSFFFVIAFFMHNYLNIHSAAQFAEHFELKMCFKLSSLKSNEYAQLTWKLGQWPGPHLSDKSLIKLRKNWHS